MPYLGNTPTANFASVTKDTFSGNGSTTAFTLSKPATTNGVAVYVENVRQIPTTAYAVSGTTLTFTGAPPSGTNNIYVMHHNTPVSTATHPAAQDLTCAGFTSTGIDDNADATAITIDSSERVGIANTSPLLKLDVTGSNTAPASSGTSQSGSLRLGQTAGNGVVDMGFDTVNTQGWIQATNKANLATNYKLTLNPNGGVVTAPTQPLTVVRYAANTEHGAYNAGSNRNIIICKPSDVQINQGSHFNTSTGQFTCPVDGTYRVSFMGNYLNNDVSNYVLIQIRKNGSSVDQYYQDDIGTWNHVIRVAYVTCSANDTLEVYNNSDSSGSSKGGFDIVQYTAFNYSLVI